MSLRVLVTRPAEQCGELVSLLESRGFGTSVVPTVAVDMNSAAPDVDAMLTRLDGAAWLIFTSANGVRSVARRLEVTGHALPKSVRIAAIGPATADALRSAGIGVDHTPAAYLTASLADGLDPLDGQRVVLARADAATPELRSALDKRGALVEEVVAYRTIEAPASSRDPLRAALHDDLAGIAFTSASGVRGLMRLAAPLDRGRARTMPAFCIGPVTAEQARHSGFNVAAVPNEHTAAGLADAVASHFVREDR